MVYSGYTHNKSTNFFESFLYRGGGYEKKLYICNMNLYQRNSKCKAVQCNHPMDPIEWDCECKKDECPILEVKTSEQWEKEDKSSVIVLDPDGWDRSNYQYSYYEELITLEEYNMRKMMSTCKFPSGYFNINK